jgi:hypothetical protein
MGEARVVRLNIFINNETSLKVVHIVFTQQDNHVKWIYT